VTIARGLLPLCALASPTIMSGYKRVRSHSPVRGPREDAESHELEEKHQHDPEGEQQERLLGGDGYGDEGHARPAPRFERRAMWLVGLLVALGVAVVVAIILLFRTFAPSTRGGEGPSPSFRRPSSDYTLDPNWDYDSAPKTREYNWVVQDIVANPDGVFRPMLVVNGKFPGEMIRCNEGDTIVVNVENQSINATTIHWHGIFQNGSNWMDGVSGVTQCPIAPGKKFQYKFKITLQSGTCMAPLSLL
jgi:hypothetical protein